MPKKHKCPVCKSELDDKTAKYVEDHMGQKYYFCSGSCVKEFSSGPERYIKD
jgi:YHS domain-containing protein